MSRQELKQAAKDQLRGNWLWAIGLSFVAGLVIYFVSDIISLLFFGNDLVYYTYYRISNGWYSEIATANVLWLDVAEFFLAIFSGMIIWGVTYTILQFRDTGNQPNIFKSIFSAYTKETFTTSFVTFLVYYIFIFLWTLLFIIPGIIKFLAYAMTPYIMKDYYDSGKYPITSTEAITASRELMKGHKWELFGLCLSFIGWFFVGVITFGIGFLWITPYIRQTMANYYRKLAGDKFLVADND